MKVQEVLLRAICFSPGDKLARNQCSQFGAGDIILWKVNACPDSGIAGLFPESEDLIGVQREEIGQNL